MSGRSPQRDGDGDDLTRISGIGPVIDGRLHQAGVTSYADLAALKPEEIMSLLADAVTIAPGRIRNEDWAGQAAKLAEEAAAARTGEAGGAAVMPPAAGAAEEAATPTGQGAAASSPEAPAAADGTGLHYESFVVRIALHDVGGPIANTTVQHVGSGTERRWAGLDAPALLRFISAHVSPEPVLPVPVPRSGGPGRERPPQPPRPAPSPPAGRAERPARSTLVAVPLTLERDPRVPRAGAPFTVSVSLDLAHVEPQLESRVRFSAVVLARPLSGAAAQVVSEGEGIVCADTPVIKLQSAGLPTGTYRLEAVVQLVEPHGGSRDLVASVEGSILVVSGR